MPKNIFKDYPNAEKAWKALIQKANDAVLADKIVTLYICEREVVCIIGDPMRTAFEHFTPDKLGKRTFPNQYMKILISTFKAGMSDEIHIRDCMDINDDKIRYSYYLHRMNLYTEAASRQNERCLCCGYKTIEHKFEYDTCPVCHWEDDLYYHGEFSDERRPSEVNNEISLEQARKNFNRYGAIRKRFQKYVREPYEHEM